MKKLLRYEKAEWSMPFLLSGNSFFIPLIYHLAEKKNTTIKYAYGCPRCTWAGGRVSNIKMSGYSFLERVLQKIVDYGTTPAFTFTNISLDKEALKDEYCNNLLKIIDTIGAEIIVASELLYEYIREKHPNIKLCCSLLQTNYSDIKDVDEVEHINKLIDKYDRVVIRPEFVKYTPERLIEIKDISKIEVLVNQHCVVNCENSKIDFKLMELFNRGILTIEQQLKASGKICPKNFRKETDRTELTHEQIQKCIDAGVTKLKLQGRTYLFDGILEDLYEYFFNSNIDRKELRKEIDSYMAKTLQNSVDLQLYALISKI